MASTAPASHNIPPTTGKRRRNGSMDEVSTTTANIMAPRPASLSVERATTSLIEDLRSNVTCSICLRLMYEPYTMSCGHTHCYSCLNQWLGSAHRKRTCPECRTHINTQPSPSYVIRDLVRKFISNPALLPEGESVEEHLKFQEEESALVEAAKNESTEPKHTLFQGRFNNLRGAFVPIIDDGVRRCPVCTWELETEADRCYRCDIGTESDTDVSDFSSIDSDPDALAEQDYLSSMTLRAIWGSGSNSDEDSDEDSDDDQDGEELLDDSFINDGPILDDEENDSDDNSEASDATPRATSTPPAAANARRRRTHVVIQSDSESEQSSDSSSSNDSTDSSGSDDSIDTSSDDDSQSFATASSDPPEPMHSTSNLPNDTDGRDEDESEDESDIHDMELSGHEGEFESAEDSDEDDNDSVDEQLDEESEYYSDTE